MHVFDCVMHVLECMMHVLYGMLDNTQQMTRLLLTETCTQHNKNSLYVPVC